MFFDEVRDCGDIVEIDHGQAAANLSCFRYGTVAKDRHDLFHLGRQQGLADLASKDAQRLPEVIRTSVAPASRCW